MEWNSSEKTFTQISGREKYLCAECFFTSHFLGTQSSQCRRVRPKEQIKYSGQNCTSLSISGFPSGPGHTFKKNLKWTLLSFRICTFHHTTTFLCKISHFVLCLSIMLNETQVVELLTRLLCTWVGEWVSAKPRVKWCKMNVKRKRKRMMMTMSCVNEDAPADELVSDDNFSSWKRIRRKQSEIGYLEEMKTPHLFRYLCFFH